MSLTVKQIDSRLQQKEAALQKRQQEVQTLKTEISELKDSYYKQAIRNLELVKSRFSEARLKKSGKLF